MSEKNVVAIACTVECLSDPTYTRGFEFLTKELEKYNIKLVTIFWDDPNVVWENYALILAIGITDYDTRVDEFKKWLLKIESRNIQLFNRPNVIEWNLHKGYLIQLEEFGITIPRTQIVKRSDKNGISMLKQSLQFDDVVIKPAIGRDSIGLKRICLDDFHTEVENLLLTEGDAIIQEFLPWVSSHGEIMCYFIDGKLSEPCIIKYPDENKAGNIIKIERHHPSNEILKVSRKAYEVAKKLVSPDEEFLYARVDLFKDPTSGTIMLNEFEALEPVISEDGTDKEAALLATAIRSRIM